MKNHNENTDMTLCFNFSLMKEFGSAEKLDSRAQGTFLSESNSKFYYRQLKVMGSCSAGTESINTENNAASVLAADSTEFISETTDVLKQISKVQVSLGTFAFENIRRFIFLPIETLKTCQKDANGQITSCPILKENLKPFVDLAYEALSSIDTLTSSTQK